MVRKRTVVWGLVALVVAFCLVAGCRKKDEDKGPAGPDETPPRVTSVSTTSSNTVKVVFNENVEDTSAEADTNYVITDLSVYDAALETDRKTVTLATATQNEDETYGITIKNVKDLSENVMADTALSFLGYSELDVWALIGEVMQPDMHTALVGITRGGDYVDDATVTIGGTALQYNTSNGYYEPPGGTMNFIPGQPYGLSITTPRQESVTGSVVMVYPVAIQSPSAGQQFQVGQDIPVSWSYQGGHTPQQGVLDLSGENWYSVSFSGTETSHTIPGSEIVIPDPVAELFVGVWNNGTITGAEWSSVYMAVDMDIVNIVIH